MADVIIGGLFNNNFMTRFWQWVITDVFSFISNYGFRVILITVLLKLLLSPVDFFTRRSSKLNAEKTEKMKPELEQLQKQFAKNPTELQRRRMALNKKYGMNPMGACLPLLITMFVFFSLFGGFTDTAKALNIKMYDSLTEVHSEYYAPAISAADPSNTEGKLAEFVAAANSNNDEWIQYELDALKSQKANKKKTDEEVMELLKSTLTLSAIEPGTPFTEQNAVNGGALYKQYKAVSNYIAQGKVMTVYNEDLREGFLWIKNVWRPDTWSSPIYNFKDFHALTGRGNAHGTTDANTTLGYDDIMGRLVVSNAGSWNGLLILVIASVGLNFLNQFISSRQQKKHQDPTQASMMGSMKIMMWMMPIMIGMFAFSQSSAFTIYMTTNATMTLLINLASTGLLVLMDRKKKPDSPYNRKA